MTLEEERNRGNEAKDLLEHPLIVEAFSKIQNEVIEQWTNSPSRDADGREKLWMMLKLLERVKAHIQEVMETGELAKKQIADIEKRKSLGSIFRRG